MFGNDECFLLRSDWTPAAYPILYTILRAIRSGDPSVEASILPTFPSPGFSATFSQRSLWGPNHLTIVLSIHWTDSVVMWASR